MVLSLAEYILLLSSYAPRFMLGVQNPFAGALPTIAQKAMEGALQALQARGLVEVLPGGGISIESSLAGLVATCAFPDISLIATYTDNQGAQDVRYIHLTAQLIVEDRVLPSGERHLTRVSSGTATERLVEQFHLAGRQAAPGARCVVAQDALDAARQIARASGALPAAQRLRAADVDRRTAAILAEALARPISNSALALVQMNKSQAGESLGFLEASHGLWLLRFVKRDRIEVSPCDGAEAAREVARLVVAAEGRLP